MTFTEELRKAAYQDLLSLLLEEVYEIYEKYKDSQIINIALADGLSGTYQGACGAREMMEDKSNVTVVNSKTLCGPHRYMVEKAQKMKEEGHSVKEILEWLDNINKRNIYRSRGTYFRSGGSFCDSGET